MYDVSMTNLIGFKLKGFNYLIYQTPLKHLLKLNDNRFIELTQVIEKVCQDIGDEIFAGPDSG